MKKLNFKKLVVLLTGCTLLFSGCGGNKVENKGAVLNLLERDDPKTLDSAATADAISINILNNVNEGLYSIDKNEQPILAMAKEEPTVSKDGLTYTFKIRDDAKWSDDKPVTAHDFEFAWKKALDPMFKSEYANMLFIFKNAEEYKTGKLKDASQVGIKALDGKTLEFTLINQLPYLKSLLAFSSFLPQRKDMVEKHKTKYGTAADTLVYNGPFTVSAWKHSEKIVLSKNAKYYDKDKVKLDTVNFKIVKANGTQINYYKNGDIDSLKLGGDQLDSFKDKKYQSEIVSSSDPVSAYLEFNQTLPLFKNKNIREAISLAINKEGFSKFNKSNKALGSLVPPSINYADGKVFRKDYQESAVKFDPKKAKELWNKGIKEVGMPNPKIEILVNDLPPSVKVADYMVEQLRKNIGANASVEKYPNAVRLDKARDGKFQIFLGLWGADYNDLMSFMELFVSDSVLNHGKWSNKKYDQLITQSQATADVNKRASMLRDAEKLLEEDTAIAVLYSRTKEFITKPYVKNLYTRIFAGDYSLKEAYIEKH